MTKLFVSYAHNDKDIVLPLARELQDLGFDVWYDDRGLIAGTNWEHQIVKAIMDCNTFILFVSFNSAKSDSVRREVSLAYKNKKCILPVKIDKVDIPPEWDYQIIDIQWIECAVSDWKSRLLVALGVSITISKLPLEELNTSSGQFVESTKSNIQNSNHVPAGLASEPARIVKIFNRDFVNPDECDEVSSSLRKLANTLSLKWEYLHLQFSLKKKLLILADRIDEFRKICPSSSSQANNERKSILENMENLLQKLNSIMNI
jgi:hypothetical protein